MKLSILPASSQLSSEPLEKFKKKYPQVFKDFKITVGSDKEQEEYNNIFIEINSLEDLKRLNEVSGEELIVRFNYKYLPNITIYDSYVE